VTSPRTILRVAEAAVALLVARVLLRFVAIDTLVRRLGFVVTPPQPHNLSRAMATPGAEVRRAIDAAAVRLPWHSTCLVNAQAGSMMLTRRKVGAVLVLGVRRDAEALAAHAWLTVPDGVICGGDEAGQYRPLASFRSRYHADAGSLALR
jgi:hypothetical protein